MNQVVNIILFFTAVQIFAGEVALNSFGRVTEVVGINAQLPLCAQACLTLSFDDCGCELANINCTCDGNNTNIFAATARNCTEKACTGADLQIALQRMSDSCKNLTPTTSSSTPSTRTNSATSSITHTPTSEPTLAQCVPAADAPGNLACHELAACVETNILDSAGDAEYFCACRAGYKADVGEDDPSMPSQWRLLWPGQEGRVFVKPGIECDVLCDDWVIGAEGCQEVPFYGRLQKRGEQEQEVLILRHDEDDKDRADERRMKSSYLPVILALSLASPFAMLL